MSRAEIPSEHCPHPHQLWGNHSGTSHSLIDGFLAGKAEHLAAGWHRSSVLQSREFEKFDPKEQANHTQGDDWHTSESRYYTGHRPNRPSNAMDKTLYVLKFELRS